MTEHKDAPSGTAEPRFFYGYVIVVAGFCMMVAYLAARSAYGIFFNPVASEFGWSSALMSGPMSISLFMDGLMGWIMGRFADKLGPRKILTIAGCLLGLGYILMSRVTAAWQMYLVYGIVVGVGMGGTYIPTVSNLNRWFIARRNTMNGIVISGMGVGTLLVSPITHWLISTYNWRTSYIILGVAFLVIIVVSAQFMRLDPAQIGQKPYNKLEPGKQELKRDTRSFSFHEAFRTPQFWLVISMYFCYGFLSMAISVHLVPDVIHLGISAATAADVLAIVGVGSIIGRLVFGTIGDRLGSKQAYIIGFIILTPALLWLVYIREAWMFYVFGALFGFAQGGMGAVLGPVVAELFGMKSHGAIFGFCGMGVTVGAAIGPVLTGYLFDMTGGYQAAFLTAAGFAIVGIVMCLILIRSKAKVREQSTG